MSTIPASMFWLNRSFARLPQRVAHFSPRPGMLDQVALAMAMLGGVAMMVGVALAIGDACQVVCLPDVCVKALISGGTVVGAMGLVFMASERLTHAPR